MIGRSKIKVRPVRRSRPYTLGAVPELLEARRLLATFVVTNTADLDPVTCLPVAGSLREAIIEANSNPGADTIHFDLGTTGVVQTIAVSEDCPFNSPLPAITGPTTIDATVGTGFNGSPLIQLTGNVAPAGSDGLRIEAANCVIKGLAIDGFSGNGVEIDSSMDTVQQCYIGLDPTGMTAYSNGGDGVLIDSGTNNTIGGSFAGPSTPTIAGNIISGNSFDGVRIEFGSNNVVQNNFIGTNISGGAAIPNGGNGIEVEDSTINQIGGSNQTLNSIPVSVGNTISGNTGDGVLLQGSSAGTSILGNSIGLDSGGNNAVPNGGDGVDVNGANQTTIGGVLSGSLNVISGNTGAGVLIDSATAAAIQGNIIGGNINLGNEGNGGAGVEVLDSSNFTIGGTARNQPNTIAFNGTTSNDGGIFLTAGASPQTTAGVSILSNSIYENLGPPNTGGPYDSGGGIVFDPAVVAKDPNPLDPTNLNDGIGAPVITSAGTAAGRTLIQGVFEGAAGETYTLQFFSNTAAVADPSGIGQGQTLIGSQQVTPTAAGSQTIYELLPNPTTLGSTITATVTDGSGNTSEFSNAETVVVAQQSDLAVTIAANPSPATVNGTITYTVTVTNNGPNAATGGVVTVTLPASVTGASASITGAGQSPKVVASGMSVTASNVTIAAGQKAVLTISGTASATGKITTTAIVQSDQIDDNTPNNSATNSVSVNVPADLGITLTGSPNPTIIGQQLSYTAVVTNYGPGPATNATITDALPSGVTFVTASSGQGTITQSAGLVTANLGTLAVGVSAALRILVTTDDIGTLSNTSTVVSDETDPNPANNSATVATTVEPAADLVLVGSASPSPALVDNKLVYSLSVANDGPSTATGVILTDLLPSDSNFVSAVLSQGSYTLGTGTISADIGSLAPQGTATVTITVIPTVSEQIVDGATVSANEFDPNTKNNTITIPTAVSPADLAVAIAPDPSTPLPLIGQNTILDIDVTNNGPTEASDAVLTDILPADATYVGAAPTQGILSVAGNTLTVQFGAIPSGTTVKVPIVVTPTGPGTLETTASVTNPQYDPDPSNNSATYSAIISPADLAVTAVGSASSVLLGGEVAYMATVTNNGPAVATDVVLSDPIPSGFQFVSATTTAGSIVGTGSTVFAAIGTLAPGASASATFLFLPTTVGTVTNTISANADQTDPNTSNNSASVTTDVFDQPGAFEFTASSYSVSESAGTASITINRNGGSEGAASVQFSTFGGSGVPNFDYTPVAETVSFADGQTTATVTVPILDNGVTQPNTTVGLELTSPTGGATIGATSTALLTIINTHPDVSGPQVLGLILQGGARSISSIQVGFTKALDPSTADNVANYTVTAPNGRYQAISSAVYDASTNVVTLTFARPLATGRFYQLVINGSSAGGLAEGNGNGSLLDGAGNGVAGSNYVATFERAPSVKYTDATGNLVTFKLKGAGYLDITRLANGNAQFLTINGATPYKTTLSGTVKAVGASATGVTTLQAINGLEPFGTVLSALTSPPFLVGNTPAIAPSVDAAIDALGTETAAILKKKHD